MLKSGNSLESAKQFNIYFVLMPSWMNKRLFYGRDPRWLGTVTRNKHHRPRLSTKYNAGFLSKSDGIDVHLPYDSILWWAHVQLFPQLKRCGLKRRFPCHTERLPAPSEYSTLVRPHYPFFTVQKAQQSTRPGA